MCDEEPTPNNFSYVLWQLNGSGSQPARFFFF